MQVLKGQGFYIVYAAKLGSSSLTQWARVENDLTRLLITTDADRDWSKVAPDDPIYAVWRPPLERVISGVYQGLILRSNIAKEPIEKHIAEWLKHPSLGKTKIMSHTRLIKKIYEGHYYQSWNWFSLSQLGSFHTYLNNKHGTSLEKAPKLNSHASPRDLIFGEDWQNKNPKIIKLLQDHIATDYIPENFIDLNKCKF